MPAAEVLPGKLRIGLASPRVAATREEGLATAGRFLAQASSQGAAIVYFASVNFALRYSQTATSLVAPDGRCVGHMAHGEEALLVLDLDLDPQAATGRCARRYAPDRCGE